MAVASLSCAAGAPARPRAIAPGPVLDASAYYPEGPQLVDDGLLVAEMPRDRVVLIAPGRKSTVWQTNGCGPTSVKRIPSGGYWVLCHLGHYVVRLDARFTPVQVYRQTASGRRISWPNDASADGEGNLYLSSAGLFSHTAPAEGRVVFIDLASGIATDVALGIHYSNGVLVQERLGRVLVSEHLAGRILSFPLQSKGRLGAASTFFEFRQAPAMSEPYELSGPDGLAAFPDGTVMVADYGNGRVLLLTESGAFIQQVMLRYRFVTNMAIARDGRSFYVTMTRDNASAERDGVVQQFLLK